VDNAESKTENVFITGGAGFLGSTFAEQLLSFPHIAKITIFDRNATNPEKSKLKVKDDRIALIAGDLKVPKTLTESMMGHDTLIHLASTQIFLWPKNSQPSISKKAR
jgi:dTDP-D-glucose 4,6-dehydratase